MTSLVDVFSEVISRLETHRFDYMVVGSIASIVYGEPRLTKDMDLVIDLSPQDLSRLTALFSDEAFYCPPEEVLRDEFVRRGQFNLIHPSSGLKVDFVFRKNSPHGQKEFMRRRRIELWPGLSANLAAPEDVILKKLDFFREGGSQKHLLDIKGILAQTEVDSSYLAEWVKLLGLESAWRSALAV